MPAFIDEYFNALFEWSPSFATSVGLHEYDAKIEDFSAAAVEKRIQALKGQAGRITAIADGSVDSDVVMNQVRAELLELETLQTWRKNPLNYAGLPGGSIDGLIKRNFAPPAERLRSVIARLKGVPALMQAMRENVQSPPREFTDLAIRIARGSVGFFKTSVAEWAKGAAGGDAALMTEFTDANNAAASSIEEASNRLEKTLLPNSKGAYAIGSENFSRKLLYEESVDTPLEQLRADFLMSSDKRVGAWKSA